ncbi:hypothetical protein SCHPADRAFT_943597 [Schizopora paradoxa]|uniref:Uncharacterized protein n=1 Tax=Schizopora paradoxa TaxID=27342 RepID=A0A0H2RJ76_9AGAM|nr:hypothetical protein SCHPADRAFT_943597 [Schizopora paradoxa]
MLAIRALARAVARERRELHRSTLGRVDVDAITIALEGGDVLDAEPVVFVLGILNLNALGSRWTARSGLLMRDRASREGGRKWFSDATWAGSTGNARIGWKTTLLPFHHLPHSSRPSRLPSHSFATATITHRLSPPQWRMSSTFSSNSGQLQSINHSPSPIGFAFGLAASSAWQPQGPGLLSSCGQQQSLVSQHSSPHESAQEWRHEDTDGDCDESLDRFPIPARRPVRRILLRELASTLPLSRSQQHPATYFSSVIALCACPKKLAPHFQLVGTCRWLALARPPHTHPLLCCPPWPWPLPPPLSLIATNDARTVNRLIIRRLEIGCVDDGMTNPAQ